ncbi:unnamed protein product [Caenorhabditis brenneri]
MAKKSSDRVQKRSRKSHRRDKHRLPPPPPSNRSFKLWIWALVILISTQQVLPAGLLRQEFNGANSTGDGSRMAAARFRRDTIKLDNAITNLGHLARIANGIALEIGLVDGTIDPGEAVAELLHMGSLTVDDVTKLNKETIDGVLNSLGDGTPTDQVVLKLENRLANLEKIRNISQSFRDVDNFPGLKGYQDSLEEIKKFKDLESYLEDLKKYVGILAQKFKQAPVSKAPNDQDITHFAAEMYPISLQLDALKTALSTFDSVTKKVAEAKKILEKSSFIDTLLKEIDLRPKIDGRANYDTGFEPLFQNFKKVVEDSETATTAKKSFETIQALVQTRGPHHRQFYKHCSGFPSGADDLDELYVSSADPFFVKHISNGETVSKNLRNMFEPFKMLEKPLDDVTKNWEPLKKPSELNGVFAEVSKLTAILEKSKSACQVAPLLRQCDTGASKPNTETTATNLVNTTSAMKSLNEKVNEMSDFAYVKQFDKIDSFMDLFNTDGKTKEDNKKRAKSILEMLHKDGNLKTFVENIKKFEVDINFLLDLAKNPPKEIEFSHVTAHLDKLKDKEYQTFLTCLGAIKTAGTPVKDLIDYISKSKQTVVSPGAKSAIANVIVSGKSLENAESAAADFKNNKALPPQLTNLKSSFDKDGYKEISKKLGMGVQGLLSIKRVREVKIVAKDVNDILKDAEANDLSQEYRTSLKQLEEIPKVLDSIETFLKSSQGLQVFRRKRDTGFQDFHQIFTDAQGIQGATVDLKSIRKAMEELNKKTNQKHATSLTQLKKLETSDLDFAKFSFKDVPSSLTALGNFFLKYATQLSVTKPPPSPANGSPGQQAAVLATADVETTPVSGGAGFPWMTILIVLGVISLIAVIGSLIYCYCCKKKATTPSNEDSLVISPSDSDSQVKDAKKGGEDPKGGKKDDDDGGSKDDKDKKGGDPKPPPSAGGPGPAGGTGPTPPPPPPPPPPSSTDQGGANPPPSSSTDHSAPPPPPSTDKDATAAPPGTSNDQAGAPTDKQAAVVAAAAVKQAAVVVPPPAAGPSKPPPLTDDEALAMVKRCTQAIRLQAYNGTSPREWAEVICGKDPGEKMVQPCDTAGVDERRHVGFYCFASSMAVITGFENNFFNCNVFVFGPDRIWYAAQGPMDGTEGRHKIDTRPKHNACIHQNGVELVLQLCQNVEEVEEDGKMVQKQKSARYYSEVVGEKVTNGDYELETLQRIDGPKQFVDKSDFTLFKLRSKHKKTGETKPVDLLLYKGWPDFGAPRNVDPIMNMLKFSKSYNHVLVHCSAGVGRTGTLIAIKLGIEMCLTQKITNPDDIINRVREIRYGAIQDPTQVTYFVYCVARGVMIARKMGFCEEYYQMEFYHRQCLKKSYDYLKKEEYRNNKKARVEQLVDWEYAKEDHVEERKTAYEKKYGKIPDKKTTTNPGKKPEGKKDGEKQPTTSDAKVDVKNDAVGEIKDSNASEKTAISEASQKTAVLGEYQEKSKKSEKNSKASVASGGSQIKSKKSQKNPKVSAVPSGSQEKSKKKSSKGEEKKSEKKKVDGKKTKQKASRSKPTKKGKSKAK